MNNEKEIIAMIIKEESTKMFGDKRISFLSFMESIIDEVMKKAFSESCLVNLEFMKTLVSEVRENLDEYLKRLDNQKKSLEFLKNLSDNLQKKILIWVV